jgi:hypothetical protein
MPKFELKTLKCFIYIFIFDIWGSSSVSGSRVALLGSSGGSWRTVVTLGALWCPLGRSIGSLVVHQTLNLESWVRIPQCTQPTVDCQSLDGLPFRILLHCGLSSERRHRRIYTIRASDPPKTIKEKNI